MSKTNTVQFMILFKNYKHLKNGIVAGVSRRVYSRYVGRVRSKTLCKHIRSFYTYNTLRKTSHELLYYSLTRGLITACRYRYTDSSATQRLQSNTDAYCSCCSCCSFNVAPTARQLLHKMAFVTIPLSAKETFKSFCFARISRVKC